MHEHQAHSMEEPDVTVDMETTPAVLKAGSPAEILFTMKGA